MTAPEQEILLAALGALFLPLVSFFVSSAIPSRYSWIAPPFATFSMLISSICGGLLFARMWNAPPIVLQYPWFTAGTLSIPVGLQLDNLSVLMVLTVTLISFLVHLYSIGFMTGDPGINRYFALIGLFTFSMLGLVIAHHLLLVFVFWELVGLSSYLLIGYWHEKPSAVAASFKALMMNRLGDVGLLIGLLLLWIEAGTLDIAAIHQHIGSIQDQTLIGCCIFVGVVAKSAQVPLFSWLPDAMEGPTPVSALIHAATMVAAGVFLVGRIHFLFTPHVLQVMAITGAVTACYGAVAALVEFDLKRILAYSTISQLGWMVMSMGIGVPSAAEFHLVTHAFFKAGLFLAAGAGLLLMQRAAMQHRSASDVQDIRHLSGLRKMTPITFFVFAICAGSLAGVPFTSGFLSKDSMLTGIHSPVFLSIGLLITCLTTIYTFRMAWFVFLANPASESAGKTPISQVPGVMKVPMVLLAAGSTWLAVSISPFEFAGWLYMGLSLDNPGRPGFVTWISAAVVLVTLMLSYLYYRSRPSLKEPKFYRWIRNNFGIDHFYSGLIVESSLRLSTLTSYIDKKWIDGLLHFASYAQVTLAFVTSWFDKVIVDGIANGSGKLSMTVGMFARSFVNGKIQSYIFWAMTGLVIITAWIIFN